MSLSLTNVGGVQVDSRIAADARWILQNFPVKFTAGYATSGHAADGEHPVGLALDIVPDFSPSRRGTWADVTRLANWAEPSQGDPRSPFRWVGYAGDSNHGPGDHLHLSWIGKDAPLQTILGGDAKIGGKLSVGLEDPGGLISGIPDVGDLVPGFGTGINAPDPTDIPGLIAGIPRAIVGAAVNALGIDGPKILLTLAFVIGGAWLVLIGAGRMAGIKPADAQELALLVASRGRATGKGAASAA